MHGRDRQGNAGIVCHSANVLLSPCNTTGQMLTGAKQPLLLTALASREPFQISPFLCTIYDDLSS